MALESLWKRDLSRYPAPAHRWLLLVVTTLVTVALYYNYYVLGSAAPQIMGEFAWSLDKYIYLGAFATLVGAISAIAAGIGDKLGRSNLLLGATGVSLVFSFLMSHAHNGNLFIVLYCLLGLFEGFALVMSSTLMRDFSPRVGRGIAMGMWTVGPVGGSYISSKVAGHLLASGHSWRDLYTVALVSGIVVWLIAIVLLRDLSPALRSAIVVEAEGRKVALKAENELQDASLPGVPGSARFTGLADRFPPRLVIPALGISLYLLMYFAAVSMFPLYLETMFKFEPSTANNMMSLFWLVNVIAALIFGGLSDWLRVRKPFLLAGAVMFFIASLLFTLRLGHPTSQTTMTWILVLMGAVVACGFAPWMAAISETAEELNPHRVAYGMAIFGSVQRLVIMVVSVVMPHIVGTEAGWRHWWIISLIGIALYTVTIPALYGGWRPSRGQTRIVDAELAGAHAQP
jgi:MFS family permease